MTHNNSANPTAIATDLLFIGVLCLFSFSDRSVHILSGLVRESKWTFFFLFSNKCSETERIAIV